MAAHNQIFTWTGIGYFENKGALAKSPDNLVNIAINKMILLIENRTSKLNTITLLLTEES